jgi:hypothetical protein
VLVAGAGTLPLYKIIYDERFASSRHFAAKAGNKGFITHAIRGEVHGLWHDDLYHQWQASPKAIAGMTTADALFLLAMMAADARLKVIYRSHHVADQGGVHPVFGPVSVLSHQPAMAGAETQWARTAAHIVTAWPGSAITRSRPHSTILDAGRQALGQDTLVSWIIASTARRV